MSTDQYVTRGGIAIRRTIEEVPVRDAIEPILSALDDRRGALLASSYEYPGRYTRWDLGFVDPPVALTAWGRRIRAEALNARGRVLLPAIGRALSSLDALAAVDVGGDAIDGEVRTAAGRFAEEKRSQQPSVFSVLRARSSICSFTMPTRTSACTARSATISRSSSSRSGCGSRARPPSGTWCSFSPTS
jgi:anthranilate synthase